MAWNGSDRSGKVNASGVKMERGQNASGRIGGILAAAVVIIGALVAWFLVHGIVLAPEDHGTQKPTAIPDARGDRRPEKIQAVEPTATAIPDNGPTEQEASTDTEAPSDGAETTKSDAIVNDGSHRPPDKYAVLPLNCDKQIAGLLYAIPGQVMIGTVDFGEAFEEQFAESLKTKLMPPEDATDDEREMIEAVNQAKEIIVKTMKEEGRTAGDILAETRRQMREFGNYKQMLAQELHRYENDEEKTDQDVSDLFDAANRMLRDNGIEPFHPNDLTREVVRQYKFDQKEEEEGKEDEQ